MIEGGFRAAERERRRILSEIDKGGKVAPTRETFATVAERWLARQEGQLRPRTLDWYGIVVRVHLIPRFGDKRLAEIDEDAIANLIAEMRSGVYYVKGEDGHYVRKARKRGYAPWTIRGVLTPLGRILGHAARNGWIASNPMTKLEKGERPAIVRHEMRILERDEIERLLAKTDARYRALIATAIFSGARQGELLGLVWGDVDLDAGLIRVRRKLSRTGERVEPKTEQAKREIVLTLAREDAA